MCDCLRIFWATVIVRVLATVFGKSILHTHTRLTHTDTIVEYHLNVCGASYGGGGVGGNWGIFQMKKNAHLILR